MPDSLGHIADKNRLKEKVMEVRKAHCEKPWPPHDREVGVILVLTVHLSGFVASDALFLVLNERIANGQESSPIFPLIQGVLAFDTPYNGLARSMFVYGAFSNYQKVSSVFNVMTALSAAAPSALSTSSLGRSASTVPSTSSRASSAAWKGWQLVAVRTGTVGAIAAGGVAAYMHRQRIFNGVKSVRNLNRDSVREGYQQGVDTISSGLAYINRGSVGRSFEYLSDHFTFVGTLLKQQELGRRLERLARLRGVGVHDYYTSLGENGVWSGGYFVPERTFCAVPGHDQPASNLFSRRVITKVEDEVQAHMSMFIRDKNDQYEQMMDETSNLVISWFHDDSDLVDDPKFAAPPTPEPIEQAVTTTDDGKEVPKTDGIPPSADADADDEAGEGLADGEQGVGDEDDELPDESPLDITAAAAAVPLPDDEDAEAPQVGGAPSAAAKKSSYMRYLMGVAQQAGSGARSYVPSRMPDMPSMPSMPSGPSLKSFIPSQVPAMPSMPSIPRPNVNVFGKKQQPQQQEQQEQQAVSQEGEGEKTTEGEKQEGESVSEEAAGANEAAAAAQPPQSASEPAAAEGLQPDPETKEEPVIAAAK
ncbi:hypothetical protein GGR56DRAFT_637787 [Xylariaceae sp. FL0804]|nr:hypothetical protein GGR56DRAFT_637787 [Xylariaceae sp. FL0804]